MSNVATCARCCIFLSIFGVVFLTIIGVLFDRQPLYTSYDIEDAAEAAANCYLAAVIYVCFIGLSIFGIWYDGKKSNFQSLQEGQAGEEETVGLLAPSNQGYGSLSALSPMPPMPKKD